MKRSLAWFAAWLSAVILVGGGAGPVAAQSSGDPGDRAAQAERHYQNGLAAVKRGDAALARRSFESALTLNPGHANAKYQLLALRGQEGVLAGRARELRMGAVLLPVVELEGMTLAEALESLDLLIRKETQDQFTPNFVIQDPNGKLAQAKVELRVRQVPARVVLKYLLDQCGAVAKFEEHAILIRPGGTGPAGKDAAEEPAPAP